MIAVAPPLRHDAPQRFLPCAPQLLRFLGGLGEIKTPAPFPPRQLLHLRDLLLHPRRGARELEKKRGHLLPLARGGAGVVDAFHLHVVEDLDCGDGHAFADDPGDAFRRLAHGGEARHRNALGFRLDGHFERGFRHETERAFAADEEACEVIPRAALPWSLPGFDHRAVREHDCQAEHPFAHRAVAVGVRAGAPRPHHAANLGAGARVRREEETVLGEFFIEVFPAQRGLNDDVKIIFVQRENLVHAPEIHADAASGGGEMTFQARAAGVGRNRNASIVAYLNDLADFFCRRREGNEEGYFVWSRGVGGPLGAGVVLEVAFLGGDVLFAEDVNAVSPGSLEVGVASFVVRGIGGCEGEGGGRCDGVMALGAEEIAEQRRG